MTAQNEPRQPGHDGPALIQSILVSGLLLFTGLLAGCDSGGGSTSDTNAPTSSVDDKIKESKDAGVPGGVILPGGAKGKIAPAGK
jgi:hypothetical protein